MMADAAKWPDNEDSVCVCGHWWRRHGAPNEDRDVSESEGCKLRSCPCEVFTLGDNSIEAIAMLTEIEGRGALLHGVDDCACAYCNHLSYEAADPLTPELPGLDYSGS